MFIFSNLVLSTHILQIFANCLFLSNLGSIMHYMKNWMLQMSSVPVMCIGMSNFCGVNL